MWGGNLVTGTSFLVLEISASVISLYIPLYFHGSLNFLVIFIPIAEKKSLIIHDAGSALQHGYGSFWSLVIQAN